MGIHKPITENQTKKPTRQKVGFFFAFFPISPARSVAQRDSQPYHLGMPFVHVNSNTIRSNRKQNINNPPLSIRKTRSAKAIYCSEVNIHDAEGNIVARVVYEPGNPLSCGAQVWIETDYDVTFPLI